MTMEIGHVDIHLVRNGGHECVGPVTLSQVKIPSVNQVEPAKDNSWSNQHFLQICWWPMMIMMMIDFMATSTDMMVTNDDNDNDWLLGSWERWVRTKSTTRACTSVQGVNLVGQLVTGVVLVSFGGEEQIWYGIIEEQVWYGIHWSLCMTCWAQPETCLIN